jgi:hypothetical protein
MKKWAGILLSLIIFCGFTDISFAAKSSNMIESEKLVISKNNPSSINFTVGQLNWDSDIKLTGPLATKAVYLGIPNNVKVKNATLNLKFNYSTLLKETATLTVEINGTPLGSAALTNKNGQGTLSIAIPENILQSNWLNVRFTGFLPLTGDLCVDNGNSASWLTVFGDSDLTINYQPTKFSGSLNGLPYPFVVAKSWQKESTTLIVPMNASLAQVIPAFYVASALGAASPTTPTEITLQKGTAGLSTLENGIFISEGNELFTTENNTNWPLKLMGTDFKNLKTQEVVPTQGGIMMLSAAAWNPMHAGLALTGSSSHAVSMAVHAFRHQFYKQVIEGNYAIITEKTDLQSPAIDWSKVSFKQLGLDDQAVVGVGQNTVTFPLNLPNDKVVESLTVDVKLAHAPVLGDNHSSLTLSLNGMKEAALSLENKNENDSWWTVSIPGSELAIGKNQLAFTFDLNVPPLKCIDRYDFLVWGTVFADSIVHVNFADDMPHTLLKQFPIPFGKDTVIVLPDTIPETELNMWTAFFYKLGQLFENNMANIHIVTASQVNNSIIKDKNLIFIGQPSENKWVANELQQAKITLGDKVGLMALIVPTKTTTPRVMLITGPTPDTLKLAMSLITNDNWRSQLNGDRAEIDLSGNIVAWDSQAVKNQNTLTESPPFFRAKSEAHPAYELPVWKKVLIFIGQNYGMLILAMFTILVIVLACIGYYTRRKKK